MRTKPRKNRMSVAITDGPPRPRAANGLQSYEQTLAETLAAVSALAAAPHDSARPVAQRLSGGV